MLRAPRPAAWSRAGELARRAASRGQASLAELRQLRESPGQRRVRAFWYYNPHNVGDHLTPWLLPRYGLIPHLTSTRRAQFAAVGSVLQWLPADFSGAVWGSGLILDTAHPLPRARFLAVRGSLTAQRVGAPASTPLGDPGLLLSRHVARAPTRWTLGLVPHLTHQADPTVRAVAAAYPNEVLLVDVRQRPEVVAQQLSQCGAVVSSSLHGLVIADSFGIPAAWFSAATPLLGGTFKFADYETVPGIPPRRLPWAPALPLSHLLGHCRAADVDAAAEGLEAALRAFAAER